MPIFVVNVVPNCYWFSFATTDGSAVIILLLAKSAIFDISESCATYWKVDFNISESR
jgi:hypothetical protein